MGTSNYEVVWTDEAKSDLQEIYNLTKIKSPQGAINVFNDIVDAPFSIRFPKQNQIEPYNEKYRRIVVRQYKILYSINEVKNELVVHGVVNATNDPNTIDKY